MATVDPTDDEPVPNVRLRALRHRKGWTQEQLEALSGVPQETISALERGVRPGTDAIFARLAKALGVKPRTIRP